jgi:hypothetical protein
MTRQRKQIEVEEVMSFADVVSVDGKRSMEVPSIDYIVDGVTVLSVHQSIAGFDRHREQFGSTWTVSYDGVSVCSGVKTREKAMVIARTLAVLDWKGTVRGKATKRLSDQVRAVCKEIGCEVVRNEGGNGGYTVVVVE